MARGLAEAGRELEEKGANGEKQNRETVNVGYRKPSGREAFDAARWT
jgi:hypothetical protein